MAAACFGPKTYSPGMTMAGTTPPDANLLIACRLSAPIELTEDFRMT